MGWHSGEATHPGRQCLPAHGWLQLCCHQCLHLLRKAKTCPACRCSSCAASEVIPVSKSPELLHEAPAAIYELNTFDIKAQQSLPLGTRHKLVWGAGARFSHYGIDTTTTLLFLPDERMLQLWNAFAPDTIALSGTLTLGLKLEHNSYSDWEPPPHAPSVPASRPHSICRCRLSTIAMTTCVQSRSMKHPAHSRLNGAIS